MFLKWDKNNPEIQRVVMQHMTKNISIKIEVSKFAVWEFSSNDCRIDFFFSFSELLGNISVSSNTKSLRTAVLIVTVASCLDGLQ